MLIKLDILTRGATEHDFFKAQSIEGAAIIHLGGAAKQNKKTASHRRPSAPQSPIKKTTKGEITVSLNERTLQPSVVLVNGSPHESGTCRRAISEVERALVSDGIECRNIWIGPRPVGGCVACGGCAKSGRCVMGDVACEIAEGLRLADGILIASPVYYAAPNASLLGALDRAFYSGKYDKWMKVGASVAVARRAGITASLDVLNKYFGISGMPIVSSVYWNGLHGANPEAGEYDLEGLQALRALGRNMAYLIKCIRLGNGKLPRPITEEKVKTSIGQREVGK